MEEHLILLQDEIHSTIDTLSLTEAAEVANDEPEQTRQPSRSSRRGKSRRLQNSRFLPFSEGTKRRKRDLASEECEPHMPVPSPFLHSLQTFRLNIYRVACVRKKYDCFAV